ncbi:phosphoinositide-3-kinase, regulatory subunit 4, partial [Tremellales sp. Uapishka_1]
MGNVSSMARASTALDSLSSSRFLKTILARHAYGPLVLKIFIKPDAAMSLRVIQRRLKSERDNLQDLQSVNTYQAFVETDKAGYLIRQWIGSNLYDRVSTQPYLGNIEKKWIAFQLLTCLRDSRNRKVAHGDVKSENVLITSDLSIHLTDFSSSFKPTFLPLDDPSDFSFFFDTSSRRTCYVAPERFYESNSKLAIEKAKHDTDWGKRDGRVTEEMDVFSTGCVLAEMWTDGRTVFNLSELFAYKVGTLGLEGILDHVDDENVKTMISQMLALEPGDRPSFDYILAAFRGSIFPEYFYTYLKDYMSSLNEFPESKESGFIQRSASQPGNKIDRLLNEWESMSGYLENNIGEHALPSPLQSHLRKADGPALLLLNVVTSSIRNCLWPSSRLHGLQLFLNLCPFLADEDKVDRIVPFVVELLSDEVAIVRAEACRTLVIVVSSFLTCRNWELFTHRQVESVKSTTSQNATYIPEYLLPQLRQLASDPDIFVRATYATGLVRLADAAVNMLEMSQATKVDGETETPSIVAEPDYDAMLQEIQSVVEDQATTLLVDSSSNVKRAMLSSIADLCLFFGRQKSNETVLSHIMTYLNDRDWLLRLAFFDGIVGVGAFIGIRAIEEYVLPLMLQALAGTAGFVASAARNLPPSDVWCILYPSVRTLLHSDVLEMEEAALLLAMVSPLSRATLVAAKLASLQNSPPGYWNIPSQKSSTKVALMNTASSTSQDSALLKDKGISPKDEKKVSSLKEFIVKQAHATRAREAAEQSGPPEASLTSGKSVSLTDLGVKLQTEFISPRTVGVDVRVDLRRLRPDLGESSSRRTSFASRSNRGGVDDPLGEVRKRLVSNALPSTPIQANMEQMPHADDSPSESAISSSLDLAALTRTGRRTAAPAVGAVHTNAVGTTTLHDEPISGRSTPVPKPPRGPVAPYDSSYEGHDAGVKAFLEQVDLENYREPLLDFGPRVTLSQRKRGPKPKISTSTFSAPAGVTMIAHLTQHTGAITSIVTSPDQLFFATSSEDSQILIWDSARLERSVSAKPRLNYRMDSAVTCVCRIENTHCLAAAGEDGQLHVLRVHVTSNGTSKLGIVTSLCASDQWIVVGSSSGTLSLWDLRFGLLLKSWKITGGGSITSIQIHPSAGKGRWVMVSSDRKSDDEPVVEVYDIESSRLVESYEVRNSKLTPRTAAPVLDPIEFTPSKASFIEDLARENVQIETKASVLALAVGTNFASLPVTRDEDEAALGSGTQGQGWMISCGQDRVVRYWDLAKPTLGFVICGSPKDKDVVFKKSPDGTPHVVYTQPSTREKRNKDQPLRPHYDSICTLGILETPFSSCVVTGDRSGILKVWRMEGGK